MEITTSTSIWLQLSNNGSSKLLKNFSKSNFLSNFKLPLGIFQTKFIFWFLVNLHHSLEHYEAWKDEEPVWSKTEILLPKKCKMSLLPCFFFAILRFYPQVHYKIHVWRCFDPKLIFVLVISIALPFQIKKKNQIPKILPMWVFVPLKCWENVEIL